MSRTVFVNPSFINPGKKAKAKKRKKGRKSRYRGKPVRYKIKGRVGLVRRNAGIAPFLQQNPLILSNPRRRSRRRRRNPELDMKPTLKNIGVLGLTSFGGAAVALTLNTTATSKIQNTWGRRATQFGASLAGGTLIALKSEKMGAAFAASMMMPLLQDLAADLLKINTAVVTTKEADIDALAADLEDVLDGMDGDELGDDEEEYAW